MTAPGAPGAPPSRSEATLVSLAQAGDHEAFARLYEKYQRPIFNYLYRQCGSPHLADDLTQDAFVRAWLAIADTGDDLPERVGPWLYRIATNRYLDHYRHEALLRWQEWARYTALFHPTQVAGDDPERDALRGEDAEELRALLARMTPRHRAHLVLREYYALSYAEISAVLGGTKHGVKSVLHRARRQLRELYAHDAERQVRRALGAATDGTQTGTAVQTIAHGQEGRGGGTTGPGGTGATAAAGEDRAQAGARP